MADELIELVHVSRIFHTRAGPLRAVDDVSFALAPGEILCLVGESGCGKSTTGKITAGLLEPTSGQVLFEGRDVRTLRGHDYRRFRRAVQIVHQDPYASLNPVHAVHQILSPPLFRHGIVTNRRQALDKIRELLTVVGLTPPDDFIGKYPHQLSGGQRQRVSIARALTVNPRFIVADEAVSMVDVSIRVSLLTLMLRLREQYGTGFLFITHDLALARYFAWEGRIGVMYLGRLVEIGRTPQLVAEPLHPYTRALLAAIPEADPKLTRTKPRIGLRSMEVPSLLRLPSGCLFHPRCPLFVEGLCDQVSPALEAVNSSGRQVACHVVAQEYAAAPGHPREQGSRGNPPAAAFAS